MGQFRDTSVTNRDSAVGVMKRPIWHTSCMNQALMKSKTICIPARNEAATIGDVVSTLLNASRVSDIGLDSILVIDDRSTDETACIATKAGARVVSTIDLCQQFGGSRGKGDAIWASLRACNTDLVGWVDGDLGEMDPLAIIGMFRPLVFDDSVQLVKGAFDRMVDGKKGEEGRVTALTARPLLELLHPEFSYLSQPLSGMFAGRTQIIGSLWLDCDYGVDIGIAIDVQQTFGAQAITEVDLGYISHRQRPLDELAKTASQVARAIVARAGISASVASDFENRRVPALGFRRVTV